MRAAVIQGGIVITVVELSPNWNQSNAGRDAWTPPAGVTVIASDVAGIGWTFDGASFTAPPANLDGPPFDIADALDLSLLKIALNHENRIRTLEGKVALTLVQFKSALRVLLA